MPTVSAKQTQSQTNDAHPAARLLSPIPSSVIDRLRLSLIHARTAIATLKFGTGCSSLPYLRSFLFNFSSFRSN